MERANENGLKGNFTQFPTNFNMWVHLTNQVYHFVSIHCIYNLKKVYFESKSSYDIVVVLVGSHHPSYKQVHPPFKRSLSKGNAISLNFWANTNKTKICDSSNKRRKCVFFPITEKSVQTTVTTLSKPTTKGKGFCV